MQLLLFETKREVITRWVIQFFESLSINPFLGIATIGIITIVFRVRSFFKRRGNEEKYNRYELIEDIILALATISMIFVVIYQD